MNQPVYVYVLTIRSAEENKEWIQGVYKNENDALNAGTKWAKDAADYDQITFRVEKRKFFQG